MTNRHGFGRKLELMEPTAPYMNNKSVIFCLSTRKWQVYGLPLRFYVKAKCELSCCYDFPLFRRKKKRARCRKKWFVAWV